jgi:hypothetical protein
MHTEPPFEAAKSYTVCSILQMYGVQGDIMQSTGICGVWHECTHGGAHLLVLQPLRNAGGVVEVAARQCRHLLTLQVLLTAHGAPAEWTLRCCSSERKTDGAWKGAGCPEALQLSIASA